MQRLRVRLLFAEGLDPSTASLQNEGMTREEVLATLRAHEPQLRAAGIVRLSLFGSMARGEAGPESDVDLLAGYEEGRRISLLDIAGFEQDLVDLLGREVDLVEEGTLKPRIAKSVEDEAIRVF